MVIDKKHICIDCHFLKKTYSVVNTGEHVPLLVSIDERNKGLSGDFSWAKNYGLSCDRGIWDKGIDPSLILKEEICDKDRKGACHFYPFKKGMSFPKAKELEEKGKENANNFRMEEIGMEYPPAIQKSLKEFKKVHPYPDKVAFIIMQFGKTEAHTRIVSAIKKRLKSQGIKGIRADDKEYNGDTFSNIQTYMHGCGFGVAVIDKIENNYFNPNVALEIGYMMALGKEVCLLKDENIKELQSDLVHKLYKEFDANPKRLQTLTKKLGDWLSDKNIPKNQSMTDLERLRVLNQGMPRVINKLIKSHNQI